MADRYEMRLYDVADDDGCDEIRPARRTPARLDYYAAVKIEHGLGRLGVDRSGELAGIDFDENALRTMSPRHVGAFLIDAMSKAAEQARQHRIEEHRNSR